MLTTIRPTVLIGGMLLFLGCNAASESPSAAQPTLAPGDEPTKRAVLIGINDYRSDEVSDLTGAENDVDLMWGVLTSKLGFDPDDIVVLKSAEATRANIISTIRTHLAQSRAGDIALLHYSGHGSQMKDRSGDEADGKDETIVPHDSRQGDVFDISDDEINGLMKEVSDRTPHVVFVLDSCHSGTAARAVAAGNVARKIAEDERQPPPPAAWALGGRTIDEGADQFRFPGAGYVMISGCRANELSMETRLNGVRQGALTFYLASALNAATDRTTYRDLMDQVSARVTAKFSQQHPQLEGTGADTQVFGIERIPARPHVLVEPAGAGARVAAGTVYGVEVSTELQVFPPGTKIFDGSVAAIGTIEVTDVGHFSASAAVKSGRIEPQSRTVLEHIRPPTYRTGVFFHDLATSPVQQVVAARLENHEVLAKVDERVNAEIRVRETGGVVTLLGREQKTLFEYPTPANNRADALQERLEHWARWFGLLEIDNPGGTLDATLRIDRLGAESGTAPESIPPGNQVRISLTNHEDQQVFFTLLDFRSDGSVHVLHPPDALPDPVEPGEEVVRTFRAALEPGENRSVDILKAIVTTVKIMPSIFQLGAARDISAGPENTLERYFRLSSEGQRALIATDQPIETASWSTQQAVLEIVRPGVRNRGFVAHFATADVAGRAARSLADAGSRGTVEGGLAGDPTMVLVGTPETRSLRNDIDSVGQAFEDAYHYRRDTCSTTPEDCAVRVEPLFDQALETSQSAPLPADQDARGSNAVAHLPKASGNAIWSLEYTRVPAAWESLRADGKPAGAEARGVVVAHPDTGYLHHPEIWLPANDRPLLFDQGWDYNANDDQPIDDTEKKHLLSNPVHGTGSSSAIISRAGCQVTGAEHCPTGVAQGAHLVPIRVNDSVINFSTKRLTQALLDASGDDRTRIKVETDLASIAMGGLPSWALWKAARRAEERGFIVIAAAGNYVRKVIWPARFDSVIAVAAVNADCEPWAHSSRGSAVDFAAPGESVWRATLNKDAEEVTGMGTGTTYATSTTAGIAALWVAKHKGSTDFEQLKAAGELTRTLRNLIQETAWQPGSANVPDGVECADGVGWNAAQYGVGIINAEALLQRPLDDGARSLDSDIARRLDDLPLWFSLYDDTSLTDAQADYRRLFGPNADPESIALYESEVMYHYATDERFADAVDQMIRTMEVASEQDARAVLGSLDLSTTLRNVIQ